MNKVSSAVGKRSRRFPGAVRARGSAYEFHGLSGRRSSATEDGDFEGDDFLPKNDQWLSTSFSRAHESDRAAETTFLETARWNSNSVPENASTVACLSRWNVCFPSANVQFWIVHRPTCINS